MAAAIFDDITPAGTDPDAHELGLQRRLAIFALLPASEFNWGRVISFFAPLILAIDISTAPWRRGGLPR